MHQHGRPGAHLHRVAVHVAHRRLNLVDLAHHLVHRPDYREALGIGSRGRQQHAAGLAGGACPAPFFLTLGAGLLSASRLDLGADRPRPDLRELAGDVPQPMLLIGGDVGL